MNRNIIIISAIWCPSCLLIKKHLKKLKQEYPSINIETLDYDLDENEVNKYNVGKTLPVIICNDKRLVGEKSYEEIISFLKDSEIIWKGKL